jgi:hypothetical protein
MARTGIKLAYLYKMAAIAVLLSCFSRAENWEIQVVEPNTGGISGGTRMDMVLDVNDIAHVVYFKDDESLALMYACNEQGGWSSLSLEDNLELNDPKTVITIDANGVIYVVYPFFYPEEGVRLVYKKKENDVWSSRINIGNSIPDPFLVSLPHDVAVDSNGMLSVLYSRYIDYPPGSGYEDATLILFHNGSYSTVEDHGNFQSGSLAIDSLSNVHLCYYDDFNEVLKYAIKEGDSWTPEIVDNVGGVPSCVWGSASLALDSNDVPHISYVDFANNDLKYAERLLSGWTTQTIIGGVTNIGLQTSIAVDSDDRISICYKQLDSSKVIIKYASGTDAEEWQYDDTITDFNQIDTAYLAIACDSYDKPHVCYTVPVLQNVEYAVPSVCDDQNHPGDVDKNCKVDFFDFSLLGQHWFETGCASPGYCNGADLDKSTVVDINDLDLLANDWLYCSLPDCY